MKAVLLNISAAIESGPVSLTDLPTPMPSGDEVLLRVIACGLCRTDLHIVEGDLALPKLPVVPGHQIVGVAERVGESPSLLHQANRIDINGKPHGTLR